MSNVVRLGIVGLGAQGGMYAKLIADGRIDRMVLGAICDIDPAKQPSAEGLGVPFFDDVADLITSGAVDAVVTTVPHFLHPDVAIAAMRHDLHALVDKPAAVSTRW